MSKVNRLAAHNQQRQARAQALASSDTTLQQKIAYAHSFAAETVIGQEDLIYTTETDLLAQEAHSAPPDVEWQRRLSSS